VRQDWSRSLAASSARAGVQGVAEAAGKSAHAWSWYSSASGPVTKGGSELAARLEVVELTWKMPSSVHARARRALACFYRRTEPMAYGGRAMKAFGAQRSCVN